jgi:type II secretory pathway pseudopilin PulG
MVMALAVTAIIGLAITSMLFAFTRATASSNDMRGLTIQQKLLSSRLDAAFRASAKVLASGSGYVVLWISDSRSNNLPDLSELRRIEYDSTGHILRSYRMPISWTQTQVDANEVNYQLTDDFNAVTTAVAGMSKFPAEVWSNSIYGWTVTLDSTVVTSARLVSYQATIQAGSQQAVVIGAAALRN